MTKVSYASSSLGNTEMDDAFERELQRIRSTDPTVLSSIVGDQRRVAGNLIERLDPVAQVCVSRAHAATLRDVDDAADAAKAAQKPWRALPYQARNELLREVKRAVESQLTELSALVSAETGKTRLEAYGEAQETVDMIEHYCAEVERNTGFRAQQTSPGLERNYDVLRPYGVFAVITPFNFPIALTVGMTMGALSTGNTVVVKPSEKTPGSTAAIIDIFTRTLPSGVVNLVHGGPEVGQHLAQHALVDGIAFTGSAEVGWALHALTDHRGVPKPVLAEMGGQNPAIVMKSADLDKAARGIVKSAFGLSGQKCSACRRVVVDRAVAPELIARLKVLADDLIVGDPINQRTNLGPVVDDTIAARVDATLAEAAQVGEIVTGGRYSELQGNYFRPTIISGLPIGHRITRDELFAPVLTVTVVDGLDEALAEANASDYGLSAGFFSEQPDEVARFLDEMEAGVLYVNREAGATTGAWPGTQSFCGWKRSGTSGKGGLGLWYLPGFMREQNHTIMVSE